MYKTSVSTHNMQMIKPENSSQGGAAKGKGQWLGDLVITNRHSAQPDVIYLLYYQN